MITNCLTRYQVVYYLYNNKNVANFVTMSQYMNFIYVMENNFDNHFKVEAIYAS